MGRGALPRPDNVPTGAEIERRRTDLGLSKTDLARMLEVTRTTVARWEAGTTTVQARLREPLARALGWLPDDPPLERSNVVHIHPPEVEAPPQSGRRDQLLDAIAEGLRAGHATSPEWVRSLRATAHLFGVELQWPIEDEAPR